MNKNFVTVEAVHTHTHTHTQVTSYVIKKTGGVAIC